MQRDLLDALRCPNAHEESWLVAMVHAASGMQLIDADLACPVCGAEYRIANGVAIFADDYVPPAALSAPQAAEVLRMAALLGVTESQQPIALFGRYAAFATPIAAYVSAPQLLVNAPVAPTTGDEERESHLSVSHLRVADRLPLGVDTLAAVAIDAAHASPAMLVSAARALRAGGRLVAPARTAIPASMRELARDDEEWVAETTARASGLVELRRRAP